MSRSFVRWGRSRGRYMALVGWRLAVAALFVGLPGVAVAADLPLPGPEVEPIAKAPAVPDWLVTIGAEVRAIPAWPGAPTNKLALGGFPLFALQKPVTRRSISGRVMVSVSLFSILVSFRSGRSRRSITLSMFGSTSSLMVWARSLGRYSLGDMPNGGQRRGCVCAAKFARELAVKPA